MGVPSRMPHRFTSTSIRGVRTGRRWGGEILRDCVLETQSVCRHPSPCRTTHLVTHSSRNLASLGHAGRALQDTIDHFPALQTAYTVFIEFPYKEDEAVVFHIVSDE